MAAIARIITKTLCIGLGTILLTVGSAQANDFPVADESRRIYNGDLVALKKDPDMIVWVDVTLKNLHPNVKAARASCRFDDYTRRGEKDQIVGFAAAIYFVPKTEYASYKRKWPVYVKFPNGKADAHRVTDYGCDIGLYEQMHAPVLPVMQSQANGEPIWQQHAGPSQSYLGRNKTVVATRIK